MGFEIGHGIERVASAHQFAATVEKLESILKSKRLIIFAKIDFSGDAQRAGLQMPPTQMLIFGHPKAGTPLMVAERHGLPPELVKNIAGIRALAQAAAAT